MIQTQLVIALLANPDVVDLIGSRLFPMRIPQNGSLPAAVYQRVGASPTNSLDGDTGLDSVRIQISSWAKTYAEADSLAVCIRSAINSSSLKSLTENIIDDEDKETRNYRVIQDFSIWIDSDPSGVSSVVRFRHVPFVGSGQTAVALPTAIADDGFYMVTKNGRIASEGDGEEFSLSEDRDSVIFSSPLAGGAYPDQGLIIYQEKITPSFIEPSLELVLPQFERVPFEGDGQTEISLPSPIVANGFYFVCLNGRVAKEGAGHSYTIHEDRDKIIFNAALEGGDYKDEGIIIYQKA